MRKPSLARWAVPSVLIIAVAFSVQSASGQKNPSPVLTDEQQSNQSTATPEFLFSLDWTSKDGARTYVPEMWGELHLRIENGRAVPREILCATSFEGDPLLQFARRIWLPADSRLRITLPVLIPQKEEAKGRNLSLHSLIIESSAVGEVLIKNDSGQFIHDSDVLVTHTLRNSGILAGSDQQDDVPNDVLNLLIAGRVSQKLNNRVTVLADQFLPADESSLRFLDHLVIAENRLLNDDAALTAVRRWLHAGGRLWITLDRVDPTILERLFGDDFSGCIVDRVGLTSVRVDKPPSLAVAETMEGGTFEFDEPVQMVRMVVSGMKVWNTVNGWPAAITKTYGEGRLLITTLGARGWMKIRKYEKESDKPKDPLMCAEFAPTLPMEDLAAYILAKRDPSLLPPSSLQALAGEYVGYAVPSWELIVGTMFCFQLLLIGAGLWLWRLERIEQLGWLGSILAIAFSVLLIAIGRSYRHVSPGTIASVQLAQAIRGTDDVQTAGVIAVYHPEGSEAVVQTTRGGQLWPDMTGLESSNRRLVTTDLGVSHWESLVQPAGLRMASFARSDSYLGRIEAHATMDSNGIVGAYSGPAVAGTDALVATRVGRIGVKMGAGGAFTASADQVLEQDQYLSANFLGDEQDRRLRILGSLLDRRSRKRYPDRPQLLLWLDRWDQGFRFDDKLKKQGTTLLALPLVIDRPPTGTQILIPAPLLDFHSRANPDGSPPSGIWNDNLEEFQERSSPGSTWLHFQIPRELLPVTVLKARVQVQVSGPMGRLELKGLKHGTIASLQTVIDPVGQLTFEIEDADALPISNDGGLSLGFSAGDPTRPELTKTQSGLKGPATAGADPNLVGSAKVNYWKIESLTVSLWATISEPTAKD